MSPTGLLAPSLGEERGRRARPHEVTIPADRLLKVPLDVDAVRRLVEHDDTLMAELVRDFAPQYLLMAKDPGYRTAERERDEEMIKLAEVI